MVRYAGARFASEVNLAGLGRAAERFGVMWVDRSFQCPHAFQDIVAASGGFAFFSSRRWGLEAQVNWPLSVVIGTALRFGPAAVLDRCAALGTVCGAVSAARGSGTVDGRLNA